MIKLEDSWYRPKPGLINYILLPVSWLFCLLVFVRRNLFRLKILKSYKIQIPVIVVGNISVGGTGKSPVVISLVNYLKQHNYHPGIISRGYGRDISSNSQYRTMKDEVLTVTHTSDPAKVGDEPVMLAQRCDCPIRVSNSRVRAAQALILETKCDVIISDDGLQHYALERDIEIVVIDAERRFGNGLCLPAGPLRERPSRLKSVDLILVNGRAQENEHGFDLQMNKVVSLAHNNNQLSLDSFAGKTVHAIAGIGNPGRFFHQLRSYNIKVIEHAFDDHHTYQVHDLSFADELPVFMTEKDAVKCRSFAQDNFWFISVDLRYEQDVYDAILRQLKD